MWYILYRMMSSYIIENKWNENYEIAPVIDCNQEFVSGTILYNDTLLPHLVCQVIVSSWDVAPIITSNYSIACCTQQRFLQNGRTYPYYVDIRYWCDGVAEKCGNTDDCG